MNEVFKIHIQGEIHVQVSAEFTVHVKAATPPPPPPNPLTVTPGPGPTALVSETQGTADPGQLVATVKGGTPPYTFKVSSGSLPDGMNLSANSNPDGSESLELVGTPTTSGDFDFTISVSDASTT